MNTTLLIFLSSICVLLCLLFFIYGAKQIQRLIRGRTHKETVPSFLPDHPFTRDSESGTDSTEVPPLETPDFLVVPRMYPSESPQSLSPVLKTYDRNMQPLAYPAKVIYASRPQEPGSVFSSPGGWMI